MRATLVRGLLALSLPIVLLPTQQVAAQSPIIMITPSSGTYNVGDVVSVSIDYCSPTGGGGFDAWPYVQFNGLNAGFDYSPSPQDGCDDHGVATGSVTIVSGTNTLST